MGSTGHRGQGGVRELAGMAAQDGECTQCHSVAYFKMIHLMLCEFYLSKNKHTLFMSNIVGTFVLVKDGMVE